MSTPDLFLSFADNLLPRYWRSVRFATEHPFGVSKDFDTPSIIRLFVFYVCRYYDSDAMRLYTFLQLDDRQLPLEYWAERPLGRNTLKNVTFNAAIETSFRVVYPCVIEGSLISKFSSARPLDFGW